MADWYDSAVREMRKLKVGDKIRVRDGLSVREPGSSLYHVRGMVDEMLVVREWSYKYRRWSYTCLSAAWWHVNSSESDFHVKRSGAIEAA